MANDSVSTAARGLARGLPPSLQGRLLAGLLGGVVLVWLATALVTWRDARHELDELLDGHLAQAAALLVAQQAAPADGEDEDHGIDAPQLHRYGPRVAFQVWHEGRLTLRSANAPAGPMVAAGAAAAAEPAGTWPPQADRGRTGGRAEGPDQGRDADRAADDGHHGHQEGRDATRPRSITLPSLATSFQTVALDGQDWRVFAARGAEADVQVFVGELLTARTAILWAVLRSTLWPMALALPLLAGLVWWVVRRGTAPLRQFSQQLTTRDPRSLDPLQTGPLPSEMRPLQASLDELLARTRQVLEAERRFTADAAHELRTPIAGIRTQAQVALAEPEVAQRQHALRQLLDGCDRATRLVAQLLTLARLEANGGPASPTADASDPASPPAPPLDLSALARRVVAELAPAALARGQHLGLDAPAPARLAADDTLTAVLLRNLLDNALRYSPDGAEVRVSVSAAAGWVTLQVDDSGPGLTEAELQHLGERFFRVLGTGQAGSGLGWSIVQRIAAVQGAQVTVRRSAALGGLAVTVSWQAASSQPVAG